MLILTRIVQTGMILFMLGIGYCIVEYWYIKLRKKPTVQHSKTPTRINQNQIESGRAHVTKYYPKQ